MKGERRKLALPKLFSNFQNLSFFKVRAHFFGKNFRKFQNFRFIMKKHSLFSNFQNIFQVPRVHFFGKNFGKFQNFRFFMKKPQLCELFSNFQNLKLSIMMFSPSSKQNQQTDSLVDSDLKKSPKPSTRCHIWTDQCEPKK